MPEKENNFPPYMYLVQVLQHCPKAGATYMQLWKARNPQNHVKILKKTLKEEYLTSTAKFRHDLLMLSRESLINIEETPSYINVEMVDWQFDADGYTLC